MARPAMRINPRHHMLFFRYTRFYHEQGEQSREAVCVNSTNGTPSYMVGASLALALGTHSP